MTPLVCALVSELLRRSVFTPAPRFTTTRTLLKRKKSSKIQEIGVCAAGVAIANRSAIANSGSPTCICPLSTSFSQYKARVFCCSATSLHMFCYQSSLFSPFSPLFPVVPPLSGTFFAILFSPLFPAILLFLVQHSQWTNAVGGWPKCTTSSKCIARSLFRTAGPFSCQPPPPPPPAFQGVHLLPLNLGARVSETPRFIGVTLLVGIEMSFFWYRDFSIFFSVSRSL